MAHTHSQDGLIHVQAELDTPYLTLGQFFAIWGRQLTRRVAADLASPDILAAGDLAGRSV